MAAKALGGHVEVEIEETKAPQGNLDSMLATVDESLRKRLSEKLRTPRVNLDSMQAIVDIPVANL